MLTAHLTNLEYIFFSFCSVGHSNPFALPKHLDLHPTPQHAAHFSKAALYCLPELVFLLTAGFVSSTEVFAPCVPSDPKDYKYGIDNSEWPGHPSWKILEYPSPYLWVLIFAIHAAILYRRHLNYNVCLFWALFANLFTIRCLNWLSDVNTDDPSRTCRESYSNRKSLP